MAPKTNCPKARCCYEIVLGQMVCAFVGPPSPLTLVLFWQCLCSWCAVHGLRAFDTHVESHSHRKRTENKQTKVLSVLAFFSLLARWKKAQKWPETGPSKGSSDREETDSLRMSICRLPSCLLISCEEAHVLPVEVAIMSALVTRLYRITFEASQCLYKLVFIKP